jgi:parallel beta-helix repeat protein
MRKERRYLHLGYLVLSVILAGHVSADIPSGWSSRDIGTTGGNANEVDGTWTVSGDGDDIWGSSDAFHFVYLPLSGDGQITARVISSGIGSNTWSKGGVMIRETLARGSKHAMMAITGGEGGGLAFQNRQTTNGRSYTAHDNPVVTPPYWVKLTREGDTITAYSSANGIDWLQQPDGVDTSATGNPVDISMADDVLAGLFVTSHAAGEIRTYTFDNVTVGGPVTATNPEPGDDAICSDTWIELSWVSGSTAESHNVYFGESFTDVTDGTSDTFRGNRRATYLTVGRPGSPYPEGLVPETMYYWRVDEVEDDGVTIHEGNVWRFFVSSGKAHHPDPPDGAQLVASDISLTWASGLGADLHTVYFGDDFDDVENAEGGRPRPLAEYSLPELEFDKTYYWRVDEIDGQVTRKGDIWSFTTRSSELSSAVFYYVDADSPDASDVNPGTELLPFKTIRRGTQSLQTGDILLIKAGTYRETVILSESGTQENPIQIWAYPGDEGKVVINAAEPVTDWRKCTGPDDCAGNPYWEHIYVADVTAVMKSHPDSEFAVRQVFQHGQLLNRSRYPDVGWSYPTSVANPARTFTDSSLTKPDGYLVGAVCHVRTDIGFLNQILITDFSRRAITLAKSPRYNISTRYGYYITSIVGEINEEGEWAYDPAQKNIFLWPQGDVVEDVEFSHRQYCLRSYAGASWNVVRGLTMRNAYLHGIYLYRSNDMTLEDNTVEHAYNFGIYVYAGTGATGDRNQIVSNTIKYCSSRGIGVDIACSYTNVEGNYVYGTGTDTYGGDLMNGQGEAIYVSGPYARVYNNRVDRTAHKALYFDGDTLGRDISYNYVTNGGLALTESGGLYTGGFYDQPEKDHIHHNIFENVFGCLSMDRNHDKGLPVTIEKYSGDAPGIYVDERGNNRIIKHNTVINSHMAGIYFHWAPGNVVRNNTLYGNKVAQICLSGRDQPGERLVDEVVLDNIMFATDAQQKTLDIGMNYDDVHFGRSDDNYFYNPHANRHIYVSRYVGDGDGTIRVVQEDMTLGGWRAMSGYDANSKEFSYLDQFEDIMIDTRKDSRIVYNPSLQVISIDLGSDKYCDVDGNKIFGSVSLQPFESKILIPCDF